MGKVGGHSLANPIGLPLENHYAFPRNTNSKISSLFGGVLHFGCLQSKRHQLPHFGLHELNWQGQKRRKSHLFGDARWLANRTKNVGRSQSLLRVKRHRYRYGFSQNPQMLPRRCRCCGVFARYRRYWSRIRSGSQR